MLNYWWVTRPKRKLDSIPETLKCFSSVALEKVWKGNTEVQLAFESELEKCGLKRQGERKDQRGSGARTYFAWLSSLGLVYINEESGCPELTEAGKALVVGNDTNQVLIDQVLKYQFPSPFSLSPHSAKTRVDSRFNIRPFIFILRMLSDDRISYLTKEEIGRIIAVEAHDESDETFELVVKKVLEYREDGIAILDEDYFTKYAPSSGKVNIFHPYSHLDDLANTLVNWLTYTELICNSEFGIKLNSSKEKEINRILSTKNTLIENASNQQEFQINYGRI